MMRERCFSPDEIGEIAALAPGSPERIHVESCPRCRALMLTYLEFLQDRSAPDGADLGDAETRLRAAYREVSLLKDAPGARFPGATLAGMIRHRSRGARWAWVFAPAAAAVLLVLGIDTGLDILRKHSGADELRSPTIPHGATTPSTIELLEPRARGEDGLELRWRAAAGASSYEIVLFGEDLRDLARLGPFPDTTCVIRLLDLPDEMPPDAVIGWQVVGYDGSDPISHSSVRTASFR